MGLKTSNKKWENKEGCYSQVFCNWFEFVHEKRYVVELRRTKSGNTNGRS